ncbi:MAG: type II secretion system protein [Rickettsiales bacterium]|jgi:hypothetical protein|nr:type II secretion system protein [Rickettsiales bacterium]
MQNLPANSLRSAFSLLEIIIVLTVISTLMVVMISSKRILADGQIKLLAKEVANIQNITDNFVVIYEQLPGDFNRASFHWSSFAANCTNAAAPSGCNGDNDGVIETYNESYRFWQHLYLAGLVTNEFTGIAGSGVEASDPFSTSSNSPVSKFSENALFFIGSIYDSDKFEPPYGNRIYLDKTVFGYFRSNEGILTAEDALAFDIKFDDAKPRTGRINAETYYNLDNNQASPYCTTLGSSGSLVYATRIADTYNTATDQRVCRLIFKF